MALDALFTWVVFPEEGAASKRVRAYAERNDLRSAMMQEERAAFDLPRAEACAAHADTVGWRLENMWALAWTLGFEPEPDLAPMQIPDEVQQAIVLEFLPGLDATVDDLLAKVAPRPLAAVVELEDLFYCAHNAVRSAQLGGNTVPPGFHPILHGGAVHERRHALTWCLSRGTDWDDTDLST